MEKIQHTIKKNWILDDAGEVEIISAGHYPDTCIVRDMYERQIEVYIIDLIDVGESEALLQTLLQGIKPSGDA